MNKQIAGPHTIALPVFLSMCLIFGGCGGTEAGAAGGIPSDRQVVDDVTPENDDAVIDVAVTPGKSGEAYFHEIERNWYWDRGVLVKRKADIDGAPDAVVVVGGLARYLLVGNRYEYQKFLTTYNSYEGIPAPDEDDLADIVRDNLRKVFQSRDHTVVGIDLVEPERDGAWIWHNALSFSAPFRIRYDYIRSDTTVEKRDDVFDIRFYRAAIDGPVDNLLATERSRKQLEVKQYSASEVASMKTLRSGL